MWATRLLSTTGARAAAATCAAAFGGDAIRCDAAKEHKSPIRRKLTPIGRFSLLSETRDAPSVPAVLLRLEGTLPERELRDALSRSFGVREPRGLAVFGRRCGDFLTSIDSRSAEMSPRRPAGPRRRVDRPASRGVAATGRQVAASPRPAGWAAVSPRPDETTDVLAKTRPPQAASPRFRSRVDEKTLEFVDDVGDAAPIVLPGPKRPTLQKAVAEALDAPLAGRGAGRPWWEANVFSEPTGTFAARIFLR